MDAKEIVKELRRLSCDWQSVSVQPEMDWAVVAQFAADLIESQEAEIAEAVEINRRIVCERERLRDQ